MKILKVLSEFKIEATGGYAIFVILCVITVLLLSVISIVKPIIDWFYK